MSQESVTFATSKEVKKALAVNDEIFRYFRFESAELDADDSDGVFLSCAFRDFEWYSGHLQFGAVCRLQIRTLHVPRRLSFC
jgi:hypothetical protein